MVPPGSACAVVVGDGLPIGDPGSVKGVQLLVGDIDPVGDGDGNDFEPQIHAASLGVILSGSFGDA